MKKFWSYTKYIIFLGAGVALFLYVYPPSEIERIVGQLGNARYGFVLIALGLALISHWSRAIRWKMLIEPLGYQPRVINAFHSIMIGYLMNSVVPRLGEVSRCVSLNRSEKIPVSPLFGTVVVERVIDLLMLVLFILLSIVLQFDVVGTTINELFQDKLQASQSLLSWTSLFVLMGLIAGFFIVRKLARKIKLFEKLFDLYREFLKGMRTVLKLKKAWLFFAHTIFIWLLYYLGCYIVFFTLPETSDLSPLVGLSVFTLATIGFIAPVPAGTGPYHYMFREGLRLYGIADDPAGAVALLSHTGNTLLNVLVGAASLVFINLTYKKIKVESDEPEE